jgi:hypothetical protein
VFLASRGKYLANALPCQPLVAELIFVMTVNSIGTILHDWRMRTVDPQTGEPYTQGGVARELRSMGVQIETRTVSAIESGTIARPKPDVVHAISKLTLIPVSVLVAGMGYQLHRSQADESAEELAQLYDAASPRLRRSTLAGLRASVEQEQLEARQAQHSLARAHRAD